MIYAHPRRIQDIRMAPLPVAGIPNFICKRCKTTRFSFKGRKKVFQGWICAECAGSDK